MREIDCVVGGFKCHRSEMNAIGELQSLLLGQHRGSGELIYIGHVGTGFSDADRGTLIGILRPLLLSAGRNAVLCKVPREHAKDTIWVQPALICTVQFLTWTTGGLLRHPVFKGWRTDKEPRECRLEPDHPLAHKGDV